METYDHTTVSTSSRPESATFSPLLFPGGPFDYCSNASKAEEFANIGQTERNGIPGLYPTKYQNIRIRPVVVAGSAFDTH
jgi:hypothetical protein